MQGKKGMSASYLGRLMGLLLLVAAAQPAWCTDVRNYMSYKSSVSTDASGPLDLWAELNYDTDNAHAPIMVVMHGYSPASTFSLVRAGAERLRDAGFFAVSVAMRGRDGSDGVRDSGGVEIFDIYDAVEAVKARYPELVDPENVSITGYSGGGGNTMSALTKFPDTFRVGAGFFGMSDYGYDPQNGWYFNGAASSHQAIMNADIGNPVSGVPAILDRYAARASNLASRNNPYSEIHLFVNHNETTCPPVNDWTYRDNAVAQQTYPGEFDNIAVHVGGYGEYEDFDGDGLNDPEELQDWPHSFPSANQQYAAEAWFRDRLLAGAIPRPQMNDRDDLYVAGYVKTRPFFLWLGDGQDAAANLSYSLSPVNKSFELTVLTSDLAVAGQLNIDTTDMAGQLVRVLLNDEFVCEFAGGNEYVYAGLRHGDELVLTTQLGRPADLDTDGDVDLTDFHVIAQHWGQPNGGPCLGGDISCDGIVDVEDLSYFAQEWLAGKQEMLYEFLLDSDPGWGRQGQWQFGPPLGQGGTTHGNPDPDGAYTGDNVFGVNLAGDYDLLVGQTYCLTAGPFDFTGYTELRLEFARWLNIDEPEYVAAAVSAFTETGGVQTVWTTSAQSNVTDDAWTLQSYPLPTALEGQHNVYIRWSYGVINARAWEFSGWNIDDVRIWGVRQ